MENFLFSENVPTTRNTLSPGQEKAIKQGVLKVDSPQIVQRLKDALRNNEGPLTLTDARKKTVFRLRELTDVSGTNHVAFRDDEITLQWIVHWLDPRKERRSWLPDQIAEDARTFDGKRVHPSPCGNVCKGCFILDGRDSLPSGIKMPSAREVRNTYEHLLSKGIKIHPYGMMPHSRLDLFRETGIFRQIHQISATGYLVANWPKIYLPPIFENQVGQMQLSFHQFDPQGKNAFGGGNYETVKRAIENIRKYNKKSSHQVKVVLNTVISKENLHSVRKYVEAAFDLGTDGIRFTRLAPFEESLQSVALGSDMQEYDVFYRQISELREKYKLYHHSHEKGPGDEEHWVDDQNPNSRKFGVYVNAMFGYQGRPWVTPENSGVYFCPGGVSMYVMDGNPEVGYHLYNCLGSRKSSNTVGLYIDGMLVVSPRSRLYADMDVQRALGVGRDLSNFHGCIGWATSAQRPFLRLAQWAKEKEQNWLENPALKKFLSEV